MVYQFGKIAPPHVGSVHVIVDAVLAANNQARFVRQRDNPAGSEVLVFMRTVAIDVAERGKPIAYYE